MYVFISVLICNVCLGQIQPRVEVPHGREGVDHAGAGRCHAGENHHVRARHVLLLWRTQLAQADQGVPPGLQQAGRPAAAARPLPHVADAAQCVTSNGLRSSPELYFLMCRRTPTCYHFTLNMFKIDIRIYFLKWLCDGRWLHCFPYVMIVLSIF